MAIILFGTILRHSIMPIDRSGDTQIYLRMPINLSGKIQMHPKTIGNCPISTICIQMYQEPHEPDI